MKGQIRETKRTRKTRKGKHERCRGKKLGMVGAGNIHTYTPSSWSQKSAAGEGAGRPQGGGGGGGGAEQSRDGLV